MHYKVEQKKTSTYSLNTNLRGYNNSVHSLYPLEAEVGCVFVVLTQVTMDGWSGAEEYIGTEIVPPRLAELTHATRDAWFNGHSVTWEKSRV